MTKHLRSKTSPRSLVLPSSSTTRTVLGPEVCAHGREGAREYNSIANCFRLQYARIGSPIFLAFHHRSMMDRPCPVSRLFHYTVFTQRKCNCSLPQRTDTHMSVLRSGVEMSVLRDHTWIRAASETRTVHKVSPDRSGQQM